MTITTHTYTEPVNSMTFTNSSPTKRPALRKVPSPFEQPQQKVTITLQDQKVHSLYTSNSFGDGIALCHITLLHMPVYIMIFNYDVWGVITCVHMCPITSTPSYVHHHHPSNHLSCPPPHTHTTSTASNQEP